MITGMVVITLAGEHHLPLHLATLAELVEDRVEATRQGEQHRVAQVDANDSRAKAEELPMWKNWKACWNK